MSENVRELNMEELGSVEGGMGGSARELPPKAGMKVYRIVRGDTLSKLATVYKTTVNKIVAANPTIKNANDITAGYYIYIPV